MVEVNPNSIALYSAVVATTRGEATVHALVTGHCSRGGCECPFSQTVIAVAIEQGDVIDLTYSLDGPLAKACSAPPIAAQLCALSG